MTGYCVDISELFVVVYQQVESLHSLYLGLPSGCNFPLEMVKNLYIIVGTPNIFSNNCDK